MLFSTLLLHFFATLLHTCTFFCYTFCYTLLQLCTTIFHYVLLHFWFAFLLHLSLHFWYYTYLLHFALPVALAYTFSTLFSTFCATILYICTPQICIHVAIPFNTLCHINRPCNSSLSHSQDGTVFAICTGLWPLCKNYCFTDVQHAQPNGIVMLNALSNDFIHIVLKPSHHPTKAFSHPIFIVSSYGSHHTLINSIAFTNKLKQSGSNVQVDVLPILSDIPFGEVFGLMKSDFLITFNDLIEIKQEVPNAGFVPTNNIQFTGMNSLDFTNNKVADLALCASRAVVFDEWQIDLALLEQLQSSNIPMSLYTMTIFKWIINSYHDKALSLPTDSCSSKLLQMAS